MKVLFDESKQKVPIKLWADSVEYFEPGCIEQIQHVASLPFVKQPPALMPDGHIGYGCPIGSVVACSDVIVSDLVGVDIGCGMYSVETSLTELSLEKLKKILGRLRQSIPVGFQHHKEPHADKMPAFGGIAEHSSWANSIVNQEMSSALYQVGTLGGGNHFFEIQKSDKGKIWFTLHSGSRNIGLKVAKYYNDLAKELNTTWFSSVDPKWDLAFLPYETRQAKDYIVEMNYCLAFALANRQFMVDIAEQIFHEETGCDFVNHYNIHHNYAVLENHYGHNVWLHRKGATLAREGVIGIIPGSQGTSTYIVEGLGNPESYNSCSHGAGRAMGRKQAVKTLNLEAEKKLLDDQGILHAIRGKDDLEEATSAYKNIDVVMGHQQDLVKVVERLSPLAVLKG
jgi:tRNA-splicing ligase RtcB